MSANAVKFDESLSIATVDGLHERLVTALAAGQDVTIDCSGATDVDLSFIQLVLAARRSAAARSLHVGVIPDEAGNLASALMRGGLVEDVEGTTGIEAWLKGGA